MDSSTQDGLFDESLLERVVLLTPTENRASIADGSFHYCSTGQAIVDADYQVIVVNELNNVAVDVEQFQPMIENTSARMGRLPGEVLVDAGYCSKKNLEYAHTLEAQSGGETEFFIATGRQKHGGTPADGDGRLPADASLRERMAAKLKTERGHKVYVTRKAIVEPVFGQIHTRQGKHVLLRGLEQAGHEWDLIAGCHNLMKPFTKQVKDAQTAQAAAAGA